MEQERRNLSERISNGQGKEPSSGPRGFIIGTFVQGLEIQGGGLMQVEDGPGWCFFWKKE